MIVDLVRARRSVAQWHPPPSHEQFPDVQSEKLQFAPVSHWNEQLPLEQAMLHVDPAAQAVSQCPEEQSMVHVPPGGHDVLQSPDEQLTSHVPFPQNERQEPDEQLSVQVPVGGHTSEQSPLEQSIVQGVALPQLPAQPPLEQLQTPPAQGKGARDAPASPFGSTIGGPPFGVPVALDPQRTSSSTPPKTRNIDNMRLIGSPSKPALTPGE